MKPKQLAATALVIVCAVLVLYFGVRFIDTLFNKVEKDITTTTSATVKNTSGWQCRELFGDGQFVQYEGKNVCHRLAADGRNIIQVWEGPKR